MQTHLLVKDNISILWDIKDNRIFLTFSILINWKLKIYFTNYELDGKKLKHYSCYNEIKDFLLALWYDVSELNINNEIERFF